METDFGFPGSSPLRGDSLSFLLILLFLKWMLHPKRVPGEEMREKRQESSRRDEVPKKPSRRDGLPKGRNPRLAQPVIAVILTLV